MRLRSTDEQKAGAGAGRKSNGKERGSGDRVVVKGQMGTKITMEVGATGREMLQGVGPIWEDGETDEKREEEWKEEYEMAKRRKEWGRGRRRGREGGGEVEAKERG